MEIHFYISLVATIAKNGILIREWDGLCYALFDISINKIALWKKIPCR